jgi:thiazolylpeptide-type bacteriocin precursor
LSTKDALLQFEPVDFLFDVFSERKTIHMNGMTQEIQLFAELENDLRELEVNTFEIEDILDAGQSALVGSACSSGCSSCNGGCAACVGPACVGM